MRLTGPACGRVEWYKTEPGCGLEIKALLWHKGIEERLFKTSFESYRIEPGERISR